MKYILDYYIYDIILIEYIRGGSYEIYYLER